MGQSMGAFHPLITVEPAAAYEPGIQKREAGSEQQRDFVACQGNGLTAPKTKKRHEVTLCNGLLPQLADAFMAESTI